MPRFSVIIPVYNSENYIFRCVDSIMSQGYDDIEVLVVNDGSTDNTRKSLDELGLKYDKLKVYHKINGGVSSARNYGLEKSSGEYIVFVDSDDYVLDGYFSFLHKVLDENNPDCLILNYFVGSDRGVFESDCKYTIRNSCPLSRDESIELFLKGLIPPSSCVKVFKRSIISDLKFPIGVSIGEDAVFTIFYLLECENVLIDINRYYVYSQDSGGVTKKNFTKKKLLDALGSVELIHNKLGGSYDEQLLNYYSFVVLLRCLLSSDLKIMFFSDESFALSKLTFSLRFSTLIGGKHKLAFVFYRMFYYFSFLFRKI